MSLVNKKCIKYLQKRHRLSPIVFADTFVPVFHKVHEHLNTCLGVSIIEVSPGAHDLTRTMALDDRAGQRVIRASGVKVAFVFIQVVAMAVVSIVIEVAAVKV